MTESLSDRLFPSAVIAILSALLGFILGRLSVGLQARSARQSAAKAVALCAIPLEQELQERLSRFDSAAADGIEQLRGFFLMSRTLVTDSDAVDFVSRCRSDLTLRHDLLQRLRRAADALERARKKHEAIRSTLELSSDWQAERDTYRRLLVGAHDSVKECVAQIQKEAPSDTRRAIAELPRGKGN